MKLLCPLPRLCVPDQRHHRRSLQHLSNGPFERGRGVHFDDPRSVLDDAPQLPPRRFQVHVLEEGLLREARTGDDEALDLVEVHVTFHRSEHVLVERLQGFVVPGRRGAALPRHGLLHLGAKHGDGGADEAEVGEALRDENGGDVRRAGAGRGGGDMFRTLSSSARVQSMARALSCIRVRVDCFSFQTAPHVAAVCLICSRCFCFQNAVIIAPRHHA